MGSFAIRSSLLLFYLIIAFIVYHPALKASFYLDDFTKLKAHEKIYSQGLSHTLIHNATNKSQLADRPILIASTWANYKISGMKPFGFKIINVFLHALTAFFLFLFLHFFLRKHLNHDSLAVPLLGGLLFLTHPMHTMTLNFILQRGAILAGLFGLLGMICFLHYTIKKKRLYYLLSILCILLSFLSKPSGLAFGIIIGLYLWLLTKERMITKLKLFSPFLFIALIPFYYKFNLQLNTHEATLPWQEYFLVQMRNYFTYLKLFIAPVNLHFFYHVQIKPDPYSLTSFLALGAHLAIIFFALKQRCNKPTLTFIILSIYLSFFPESSFFPIKHLFFEYRSYLPYIFLSLGLSYLLIKFNALRYQIALSIFISLMGILSIIRNHELHSDTSWRASEVDRNSANHDLNYPLLNVYINKGNYSLALSLLKRLTKEYPEHNEYIILLDALNQKDLSSYLNDPVIFNKISPTQQIKYKSLLSAALKEYYDKILATKINDYYASTLKRKP